MNIPDKIIQSIQDRLQLIETEHNVRILYACESGSRAWGFASTDSDWDVRFIYMHQPKWYVTVDQQRRFVIDGIMEGDLDFSGWDIVKALQLLNKSNPPLLEWMKSPIVYLEDSLFGPAFRDLIKTFYSPWSCFKHYFHMANGNATQYVLDRPDNLVSLKKYLYVLRPILACRWIEKGLGEVPILFSTLLNEILPNTDEPVRRAIDKLLAVKMSGVEMGREPSIPILDWFIREELTRMATVTIYETVQPERSIATLDAFLHNQLRMETSCG